MRVYMGNFKRIRHLHNTWMLVLGNERVKLKQGKTYISSKIKNKFFSFLNGNLLWFEREKTMS